MFKRPFLLLLCVTAAACDASEAPKQAASDQPSKVSTFSIEEAHQLLDLRRTNPAIKPAPKGLPKAVAASLIGRDPVLICASVTDAYRVGDGSIVARCSGGETYRVGDLFEMGQGARLCAETVPLTQQRPC